MKFFKKKSQLDEFVSVKRSYILELETRISLLETKVFGKDNNRKQWVEDRIEEMKKGDLK